MKPTHDEIATMLEAADWPITLPHSDFILGKLRTLATVAYAAGRKAGMKEAIRICETMPPWPDCRAPIADAIRAAMEAYK